MKGFIKLDNTINIEHKILDYINNNEIFWYNNLLKDLELKESELYTLFLYKEISY